MGIAGIKDAFVKAGGGKLICSDARMNTTPAGAVLHFEGQIDNGASFSVTSDPFAGDEYQRARQMAADLIVDYIPSPPQVDEIITASTRYVHHQHQESAGWNINHNLGYYPSVTILMGGGVEVDADITHITNNRVAAQFVLPTSGLALCN